MLRSRLFVTGVVLAGLGAIAFVVGAVAYFAPTSSKINHFQRVVVAAGSGSVRFDEPGNYVAYYESPAITGDTKAAPLVQVELTTPSGHRFPLTTPYGAHSDGSLEVLTYSNGGHHGIAMYQFDIERAGTYRVGVHAGSEPASDGVVAFGDPITHDTVGAAAWMGPGAFLAFAGTTVLIVAGIRFARANVRPLIIRTAPESRQD